MKKDVEYFPQLFRFYMLVFVFLTTDREEKKEKMQLKKDKVFQVDQIDVNLFYFGGKTFFLENCNLAWEREK